MNADPQTRSKPDGEREAFALEAGVRRGIAVVAR